MKIQILDTQDGNGCALKSFFVRDEALQAAQDWLRSRDRLGDQAAEDNFNDNMDRLMDGEVLNFADGARLHLGESELDFTGIVESIQDAQHTLALGQSLLETCRESPCSADSFHRAQSRYFATEQQLHLTLKKLKGLS